MVEQLPMTILFGFKRRAIKRFCIQHFAAFGQAKAMATLPGTQDDWLDEAFRAVAAIKKLLPCFMQLLAMYIGGQLNSTHSLLQLLGVFLL